MSYRDGACHRLAIVGLIVLTIALSSIAVPVLAQGDECGRTDAPNSKDAAASVPLPAACKGEAEKGGSDWFSFQATLPVTIGVAANPGASLELWDATADRSSTLCQVSVPEGSPGAGSAWICAISSPGNGVWKIGILPLTPTSSTYVLTIAGAPSAPPTDPQRAACEPTDAGSDTTTATELTPPRAGTGCLGAYGGTNDDEDWYKVSLARGQRLSVVTRVVSGSQSYGLKIFGQHGVPPVQEPIDCLDTGTAPDSCSFRATWTGTAFIEILRNDQLGGTYLLAVAATNAQNDCGLKEDAAESAVEAKRPLPTIDATRTPPTNGTCAGSLDQDDPVDVYKLPHLYRSMAIGATITEPGFRLSLVDPNGTTRATVSATDPATTDRGLFRQIVDVEGDWYLDVQQPTGASGGGGMYTLTGVYFNDGDCLPRPKADEDSARTDAGNDFASAVDVFARNMPSMKPAGNSHSVECDAVIGWDPADTEDWYQIPAHRGTLINAWVSPPTGSSLDLELLRSDQGGAKASGSPLSFRADGAETTGSPPTPVPWRLRVMLKSPSGGTYRLHFDLIDRDCRNNGDAPDSAVDDAEHTPRIAVKEQPSPIPWVASVECDASFFTGDDWDVYDLPLMQGDIVDARITWSTSADYDLELYNAAGERKTSSASYPPVQREEISFVADPNRTWAAKETWTLRVKRTSGTGAYHLKASILRQNDCDIGHDAAATSTDAALVTLPLVCSLHQESWQSNTEGQRGPIPVKAYGQLAGAADSEDWYRFTLPSTAVVTVTMQPLPVTEVAGVPGAAPASNNFDLYVKPPSRDELFSKNFGGLPESLTVPTSSVTGDKPGEWIVKVKYVSGEYAPYVLSIVEGHL